MSTPRPANVRALSTLIQGYARFHQLRRRDKICRHGISVSQCYALEAVVQAREISITALGNSLGLNKSSASRVADALASLGLVTVAATAGNARTKIVAPTAAGVTLATRIHRDIEVEHSRLLKTFSDRDVDVARRLLTALMAPRTTLPCTSD